MMQMFQASYGGTSHTDPTNNAFQCSGTGQVTRKNGVYINSDLINEYQYTVRIRDSYNTDLTKQLLQYQFQMILLQVLVITGLLHMLSNQQLVEPSVYVSSNGRSGTIYIFS